MAREAGDGKIRKYEDILSLISRYAEEHFFNPENNLFVAGDNEYNIASKVWMMLSHVMSDEMNRKIMETTVKELFRPVISLQRICITILLRLYSGRSFVMKRSVR